MLKPKRLQKVEWRLFSAQIALLARSGRAGLCSLDHFAMQKTFF
jgi:hypothetical protein